jgi:hypothetical protein
MEGKFTRAVKRKAAQAPETAHAGAPAIAPAHWGLPRLVLQGLSRVLHRTWWQQPSRPHRCRCQCEQSPSGWQRPKGRRGTSSRLLNISMKVGRSLGWVGADRPAHHPGTFCRPAPVRAGRPAWRLPGAGTDRAHRLQAGRTVPAQSRAAAAHPHAAVRRPAPEPGRPLVSLLGTMGL